MTTFQDGPAKDQTLYLRRAPFLLRVAQEGSKFDALDQLEDVPRAGEVLHCYQLAEYKGSCHIRRTGGGGFYVMAEYKLREPQPTDAEMRSNAAWAVWCDSQPEAKEKRFTGQQGGLEL